MEALAERKASLRIAEELGDSIRIARAHLNLGNLFKNIGTFTGGLQSGL
jgi:hypothetical protein